MNVSYDVIVVGGGLAGLSCAFELCEAGRRPLLLEAQPWMGGRTASWTDPEGMRLESGLHRVPQFYRALPALLRRAGLDWSEVVTWEDGVEFRQPEPLPSVRYTIAPGEHPLRMIGDLLGNNEYLGTAAKVSLGVLVAAGLADHATNPLRLDQQSILDYAIDREVHPQVVAHLIEPLSAGIYFVPASRLSAYVFFSLIAPYLPNVRMQVGAFAGGMTEVMAEPLAEAIRQRGGEVLTSAPVEELILLSGRAAGVIAAGVTHEAGQVVLASSLRATQDLLSPHFAGASWALPFFELGPMPAVTLQIELDSPAWPVDRTIFGVGTSLACFAEQSRTTFRGLNGRVSVIMAPAHELVGVPDDRILELALEDADRLGLPLRGHIERYRVVRHVNDFYSLEPGNDFRRPSQQTPVPGLSLAGDYTRQPYVATMEGAVVSGQLAAQAALAGMRRA